MNRILIIVFLFVFLFTIFANDQIMQNNTIYAQVESLVPSPPSLSSPPSSQSSDPLTTAQSLLKTLDENAVKALEKTNTIEPPLPSSDASTISQSILKTLVDGAVEALQKTNTTKSLLNLNIVFQALKESNENSSSIETTKLLLNDAIQAINNNDTTRASAYMGLASQQLGVEPSKVDTQSTTSNTNTIASKNYLLYENPTVGIKMKYPDNWSLRTYSYNPALNNTVAGFYSPSKTASEIGNISGVTGLFVPYVDIFVFPSKNMSLDNIIDSRIDRIQNSTYSLIDESEPFTLKGNQPAYTLIYSINSGKDELFKKMQVYTIYNNKVYLITFTSQEALFAEYRPTIQEMVNSFELLKRTDLL
jgi:PsbP-like protein